jgi:[acyl-carrier-protein] S-malonyltransferase
MKIGFVFSGFGSQWVGMGKDLYDESRKVQELFEEASSCLDMNFVKLCFASSDAELSKVENAYVAIYLVSISIGHELKDAGIVPCKVAGYDIGEYSAVSTIEGLSIPDSLYLLKKYAGFYQAFLDETPVKGLRVTGIELENLEKLCKKVSKKNDIAVVAVHEGRDKYVVAATYDAGLALEDMLRELSYVAFSDVSVGGGFHAPVMDGIVKQMKMYLEKVDFKDSQIPLVAEVIGQEVMMGESIRAAVMQSIHAQTQWQKVKEAFCDCDYILEIGPGKTLEEGFSTMYPDKKVYAINNLEDIKHIKRELGFLKQTDEHEGQIDG